MDPRFSGNNYWHIPQPDPLAAPAQSFVQPYNQPYPATPTTQALPPALSGLPVGTGGVGASNALPASEPSRSAKLFFDPRVHPLLQYCFSSLRKGIPWFPAYLRNVHVSTPAFLEDGKTDGLFNFDEIEFLRSGNPKFSIQMAVKQDPTEFIPIHDLGRILYYFTHELGDHALNYAVSLSQHKKPLPEMVDHLKLFSPSNESNSWHAVVRSVLNYIDIPDWLITNAHHKQAYIHLLKIEFLKAYANDVEEHCWWDFGGREYEEREGIDFARNNEDFCEAGLGWAKILLEKANDPNDEFWHYSGSARRRIRHNMNAIPLYYHVTPQIINPLDYSSGTEDDPTVPGGPMATTKEDLEEAIDYQEVIQDQINEGR